MPRSNLNYFDGSKWRNLSREESGVTATGGTVTDITVSGVDYRVHTFTSSDDFVVSAIGTGPGENEVEYLVVGGGGGGSSSNNATGSGGDSGGIAQSSVIIQTGTYPVVIGAGGNGSINGAINGSAGAASTFNGVSAAGGALGVPGQSQPLGGDGAGESATDSDGGDGLEIFIAGTATYYAGGGGGADNAGAGVGGQGGGGDAVNGGPGENGTDGLGGGGGAGRGSGIGNQNGGNGGDGVVIIRYPI